LIWRGFRIAQNAPSKFSSLLVMGIMLQVGIQVFLNIGVVSGALPSTGVSLPFFSYGGSSLVILMAEMGIVLNVSRYSYTEKA
jgi:cell division protein FtsW